MSKLTDSRKATIRIEWAVDDMLKLAPCFRDTNFYNGPGSVGISPSDTVKTAYNYLLEISAFLEQQIIPELTEAAKDPRNLLLNNTISRNIDGAKELLRTLKVSLKPNRNYIMNALEADTIKKHAHFPANCMLLLERVRNNISRTQASR